MAAKAAFGVGDVTWQAFALAQGMKWLLLLQLSASAAHYFPHIWKPYVIRLATRLSAAVSRYSQTTVLL